MVLNSTVLVLFIIYIKIIFVNLGNVQVYDNSSGKPNHDLISSSGLGLNGLKEFDRIVQNSISSLLSENEKFKRVVKSPISSPSINPSSISKDHEEEDFRSSLINKVYNSPERSYTHSKTEIDDSKHLIKTKESKIKRNLNIQVDDDDEDDDDDYWNESNDDPKNISDEYSNSFDGYIEFDEIGQKDSLDPEFEFNIDYTKDKKLSSVLQTQKDTIKKKNKSSLLSKDKSSFFDDIPEFTYDNDNM